MSTESLPPLDGPSQVDTVQQHVVHGLLMALYGASPEDSGRRVHDIFSYIDRQCSTRFRKSEEVLRRTASPIPESEVAHTKPLATSRGTDSNPLTEPPRTTPQITHSKTRFRSVSKVLVGHWRASIGGLAAAAVIVFAVVAFLEHTQAARADDALFRRIAIQFVFLPAADPFLSDDPTALANRLAEIENLKTERDKFVRLAAKAPDEKAHNEAGNAAMQPWQGVYRRLRDLGRLQEALIEAQELIAYIQADAVLRNPQGSLKSTLADVGNIYMAAADYPRARQAYMESIDVRIRGTEEIATRDRWAPDRPDRFTSPVHSLTPLYRSMILLCIAEGKFEEAHQWLQRTEDAFRDYFAAICRANGISVADGLDALTAFRTNPPIFQNPPTSLTQEDTNRYEALYRGFVPTIQHVTKFREYLLVSARLALAEERTSAADETLRIARSVPYSGCHDESRLDFNEPLLAARIAIAEKRYHDASTLIAEAERHTGVPPCSDQANNRPIASARIAELTLLKGVVLLGANDKDEEGAQLVEKAISVPMKLAASLPFGQREAFLNQFQPWRKMAEHLGRFSR